MNPTSVASSEVERASIAASGSDNNLPAATFKYRSVTDVSPAEESLSKGRNATSESPQLQQAKGNDVCEQHSTGLTDRQREFEEGFFSKVQKVIRSPVLVTRRFALEAMSGGDSGEMPLTAVDVQIPNIKKSLGDEKGDDNSTKIELARFNLGSAMSSLLYGTPVYKTSLKKQHGQNEFRIGSEDNRITPGGHKVSSLCNPHRIAPNVKEERVVLANPKDKFGNFRAGKSVEMMWHDSTDDREREKCQVTANRDNCCRSNGGKLHNCPVKSADTFSVGNNFARTSKLDHVTSCIELEENHALGDTKIQLSLNEPGYVEAEPTVVNITAPQVESTKEKLTKFNAGTKMVSMLYGSTTSVHRCDSKLNLKRENYAVHDRPTNIPTGCGSPGNGFVLEAESSRKKLVKFNEGSTMARTLYGNAAVDRLPGKDSRDTNRSRQNDVQSDSSKEQRGAKCQGRELKSDFNLKQSGGQSSLSENVSKPSRNVEGDSIPNAKGKLNRFNAGNDMARTLYGKSFDTNVRKGRLQNTPSNSNQKSKIQSTGSEEHISKWIFDNQVDSKEATHHCGRSLKVLKAGNKEGCGDRQTSHETNSKKTLTRFNAGTAMSSMLYGGPRCIDHSIKSSNARTSSQIAFRDLNSDALNVSAKARLARFNSGNTMASMLYGNSE